MNKSRWILIGAVVVGMLLASTGNCFADDGSLAEVQTYDRAIHVMAMLLVGFGFLMVFVRKYGRSALTATFLLVSVAIPLYFVFDGMGVFGDRVPLEADRLVLAEFAGASLLICAGAVLGRLKMYQYLVLAVIFVPLYMLNEWLLVEGGLINAGNFVDTGGSIVIHAFGALFGLGVVLTMTTREEFGMEIETNSTSEKFSMLGSMVLWIFWPSFCAALVAPEHVPFTAVNVVMALSGSTLATYVVSTALRRKMSIADIANAALAGGVAIGATCEYASHPTAFLIGIIAGAISVVGFAIIQPKLQGALKMIDTCGVMNLHGMPGLMGGIAAVFVVSGINRSDELLGIGITIGIALAAGYATGLGLLVLGRRSEPYDDAPEFLEAEA